MVIDDIYQRLISKAFKLQSIIRERSKTKHRSSGWEAVRDAHILKSPLCVACGGNKLLQVHHIVPFSVVAGLELDPDNLLTLCMGDFDCHLKLGHGGSFRRYNDRVVQDAMKFHKADIGQRLILIKEIRSRRRID